MTGKKANTEAFKKYERLLHSLAHKCASHCGREEADAFGEACELFMIAVCEYDPERSASFGTYLYSVVRNGLNDWGRKMDLPKDECIPEEASPEASPYRVLATKDWLANLNAECREVAGIILNGPAEVLDLAAGPTAKAVRGALYRYLKNERGW
jgi:RNA polymerase sigma factor (sigma-70 family)